MSDIADRAEELVRHDAKGGFPAQQQEPPGLTSEMTPLPDHGEETYVGHGRLEGRRALITGGDSGIGRAVAIAYAREGADVAICYLPAEQSDAEDTTGGSARRGAEVRSCPATWWSARPASTSSTTRCASSAASTSWSTTPATTGTGGPKGSRDCSREHVERVLRTNLDAVIWLCQAALPHLAPGSSIINTTSIQAYDPSPALLDYAATKAALNNLTVNLAAALGPKGIRVNAVAPGPDLDAAPARDARAKKIETFGADTPLGRAGQPGEVARPTCSSPRPLTRATSRGPSSASPAEARCSEAPAPPGDRHRPSGETGYSSRVTEGFALGFGWLLFGVALALLAWFLLGRRR